MQKSALFVFFILVLWMIICLLPAISLATDIESPAYRVTVICEENSTASALAVSALKNVSAEQLIHESMNGNTIIGIKTADRQEAQNLFVLYKSIPAGTVVWEVTGEVPESAQAGVLFEKYPCQQIEELQICTLPVSQSALRRSNGVIMGAAGFPYLSNWY